MKTKSVKMKRLRDILVLAGMMAVLASCQESDLVYDYETSKTSTRTLAIEFGNYVEGMTRASRVFGNSFVEGDSMEVYGYMKTGDIVDLLFNKQSVVNTGELIWDYSPKKFWNVGSEYEFYAIFPYSDKNSFDLNKKLFSVSDYTVETDVESQEDLMIAQRILNANANNLVNFVFNHTLANISFYLKTSSQFDTDGISAVEVVSFDVKGLYNKGSFAQTDWNVNNNSFNGVWTADPTSVYDLPEVTNVVYHVGDDAAVAVTKDQMLLPQAINRDAVIEIVYKLVYEDGTTTTFTKSTKLGKIVGSNGQKSRILNVWEPNYRYNYIISIDPSKKIILPNSKDDSDQDDYDGDDPDTTPNVNIIAVDDDGDGVPDEYWLDDDLDGNPDYPVIWEDIDGDGKEEAIPDRDGDGQPDDADGDGNPDVIWIDTDGDGEVDTELEREPDTISVDVPTDPSDPNYPDQPFIDFNGGVDDYLVPSGYLVQDEDGEYWIDTDGDGQGDIQILWQDIDGDGKLEGIADRDGDGKLTPADSYDNDDVDMNGNPSTYDVIMVDTDGDGIADTELEKEVDVPVIPESKEESTAIEFAADVEKWTDNYDAEYMFMNN